MYNPVFLCKCCIYYLIDRLLSRLSAVEGKQSQKGSGPESHVLLTLLTLLTDLYTYGSQHKNPSLGFHCHVHSLPHRLQRQTTMFTLQTFTSILAFLSFSVRAFPLFQRDVIAPKIIQPNASSVWPIGTQQTVIWYFFSKLHS